MEITASIVKELRETTGAGMMDCKRVLVECDGNIEEAVKRLREKGLASAAKRSSKETFEGVIESYIHMGGKIGVLVEVNCETDFVARNDAFKQMVKDIAMQIAAARPLYVSREEVPQSVIEAEKAIYMAQAANEGKPQQIADKIADGRIEKFYKEICLLDQAFVKEPDKTVSQLIQENIGTLGENMIVRRFARFERGESIDKSQCECEQE